MTDVAEPRRLLRLITRLNIGGPARQALALTRRLRPTYDTVLAAGRPGPSEGELTDPAVAVHHVPLVRPVVPRDDLRALAAVGGLLRRHRPALVHTHMAKAGTIGRIAARTVRSRPVTVHTFHGHVLDGYFSKRVESAFVASERVLARATDVLVAVSEEVRDDLLELGVGRPEQYRVIRLGFDLSEHLEVREPSGALREHLGVGPDELLVGLVGRLVPIKDHETALEAVRRIPDVHMALLGDGELRATLEERARRLGVADRVHFVGWWTDIPAAMADMDVVALSSRNEGTPVSLIEAGACGRPVVSTDVGGVASVVSHAETGLLVPPADPVAFAAALDSLLADRSARTRMGAAGRVASSRFTLDRLEHDIRSLYAELLGPEDVSPA